MKEPQISKLSRITNIQNSTLNLSFDALWKWHDPDIIHESQELIGRHSNTVPQSGLLFIKECCIVISFQIVFKFVFLAFIFSGASKGLLFFFIRVKWVVEFSRMCTKLVRFLPKNENTPRKLRHNARFSKFAKIEHSNVKNHLNVSKRLVSHLKYISLGVQLFLITPIFGHFIF